MAFGETPFDSQELLTSDLHSEMSIHLHVDLDGIRGLMPADVEQRESLDVRCPDIEAAMNPDSELALGLKGLNFDLAFVVPLDSLSANLISSMCKILSDCLYRYLPCRAEMSKSSSKISI